jgi:hypothetical protein
MGGRCFVWQGCWSLSPFLPPPRPQIELKKLVIKHKLRVLGRIASKANNLPSSLAATLSATKGKGRAASEGGGDGDPVAPKRRSTSHASSSVPPPAKQSPTKRKLSTEAASGASLTRKVSSIPSSHHSSAVESLINDTKVINRVMSKVTLERFRAGEQLGMAAPCGVLCGGPASP